MIPRTLTNVVWKAAGTPRAASGQADRITWETIQAVRPDGRYVVLGQVLATTGQRIYRLGDRVPVAWVSGVPTVILGHSWRRAQFHEVVVLEEARLEAAWVGRVGSGSNLVVAFFIASEKGVFALKHVGNPFATAAPFDDLRRIGWGRKSNVLLVEVLKNETTRVLQAFRIRRGETSAAMPTTDETVQGVPVLDTELIGEFPVIQDLVIPGSVSVQVSVTVEREVNGDMTETFDWEEGGFSQHLVTLDQKFRPLAKDTKSFTLTGTSGLNLDGALVQNVMSAALIAAYVDEDDHVVGVYRITWVPEQIAAAQTVAILENTFPEWDASTFGLDQEGPHGSLSTTVRVTEAFHTNNVASGIPLAVQDLVVVDLTARTVLGKSFTSVAFQWSRRQYQFAEFRWNLRHLHKPGEPAGGNEDFRLGANNVIHASSNVFGLTVSGRDFFGLQLSAPLAFTSGTVTLLGTIKNYDITQHSHVYAAGEHRFDGNGQAIASSLFAPSGNGGGEVLTAVDVLTGDLFKIVRWRFAEGGLDVLVSEAGNYVAEVIAHGAAVFIVFRNFVGRTPAVLYLLTDVVRSVAVSDGNLFLAPGKSYLRNLDGDRRLYSALTDDGGASFSQKAKPPKDILGSDTIGSVLFQQGFPGQAGFKVATFHVVGG